MDNNELIGEAPKENNNIPKLGFGSIRYSKNNSVVNLIKESDNEIYNNPMQIANDNSRTYWEYFVETGKKEYHKYQ